MAHLTLPFRPFLAASTILLTLLLGLIVFAFEAEGGVWADVYIGAAEVCDGKNDCPLRNVVGVTTRAATPFGSWSYNIPYYVNGSMSADLVQTRCSALDEWAKIQNDPVSAAAAIAAAAAAATDDTKKGGNSTAPAASIATARGNSTSGNYTSESPDRSNKSGNPLKKGGDAAIEYSGKPLKKRGEERNKRKMGAASAKKPGEEVTGWRRETVKEKKARERKEKKQRERANAKKREEAAKRGKREAEKKLREAMEKAKRREAERAERAAEKSMNRMRKMGSMRPSKLLPRRN